MLFDTIGHMKDLLLIDKPKGISSFDVIRQLRKKFEVKKMGHAGTLDPLATGLLVVGVGEGTKKLRDIIGQDKIYEAEIVLGEKRATGDMEGEIIEEKEVKNINEKEVQDVLQSMKGSLILRIPAYSAIRQGGVPLYKKARRGESVVPPPRVMEVKSVELHSIEQKEKRVHVFVTFKVSSGTYIRSLAEEFGERLGFPATLGNLRRTQVGNFSIEDAETL